MTPSITITNPLNQATVGTSFTVKGSYSLGGAKINKARVRVAVRHEGHPEAVLKHDVQDQSGIYQLNFASLTIPAGTTVGIIAFLLHIDNENMEHARSELIHVKI